MIWAKDDEEVGWWFIVGKRRSDDEEWVDGFDYGLLQEAPAMMSSDRRR